MDCFASLAMTAESALRLRRRPLAHASHPGHDIGIGGIERLADLAGEIEPAVPFVKSDDFLSASLRGAIATKQSISLRGDNGLLRWRSQ
jgi:hypothetical protein